MAVADVRKGVSNIPAVFQGIDGYFYKQNEKPSGDWNEKSVIF
jgi:hypothetical protein